MARITAYLGTYQGENSRGIYSFSLDLQTGKMTEPSLVYPAADSKYLCTDGSVLASLISTENGAGAALLDPKVQPMQCMSKCLAEQSAGCYVAMDEDFVYTAHYSLGTVQIYRRQGEGLSHYKTIDFGERAGCHQILLHENLLLVPCLLQDKVYLLARDKDFAVCGQIEFEAGTGPRHGVFSRSGDRFYLLSELSNEIFVYACAGNRFTRLARQKIVAPEAKGAASAALRLSSDGRFLYLSTRGVNQLTVVDTARDALSVVQQIDCGGRHPRDIALTPDGSVLLSAGRESGSITSFLVDRQSGRLQPSGFTIEQAEAVSLVFFDK